MKLHFFQHVPFEGLGLIENWARRREAEVSATRYWHGELTTFPENTDILVIPGGPMGVSEDTEYPWLKMEKEQIELALTRGIPVLGICLGAQLIADVLGAKVRKNPCKEIGWFDVTTDAVAEEFGVLADFPEAFPAFHWHGETFEIPSHCTRVFSSEACPAQGFVYNTRVVALQFHIETTPDSAEALIQECGHELIDGPWIQTAEEIRSGAKSFAPAIAPLISRLLERLAIDI